MRVKSFGVLRLSFLIFTMNKMLNLIVLLINGWCEDPWGMCEFTKEN